MEDAIWRKVAVGDNVETARREPIGRVVAVLQDRVIVKDSAEGRELEIPRAALASRRARRVRLIRQPVAAAGEGPERFVRRPSLDDDWVAEQTLPAQRITVETDDPLRAEREGTEPGEDIGDALDNAPTELE
jgi:hypothetical protein